MCARMALFQKGCLSFSFMGPVHGCCSVWKSTSASGALSHFSAMTLPCWLRRAVTNRHRHAIEQASHRWRGGRRENSARTRRKILISAQVASFSFVGVAEHYHASICIFEFWVSGALPKGCDCEKREAFSAAANATTLMVHGVPRLSVDTLPADVRAKITRFTAQDLEVYGAGFRRFAEAAGVVEAATGTRVLCALGPATRSALGATTAGRRLVAALDAGARPRPKPGLLPRRADGVGRVEPACSFH